jgi:hypothetical protein
MPDPTSSGRRATISAARLDLLMTLSQLWLAYVGVGGNGSLTALERWMEGAAEIPDRDYDYLAQGLNDELAERGQDHPVPYCEELAG